MKSVIIVIWIFFIVSCGNSEYRMDDLKKESVKFEDLPVKLKEFYYDPSEFGSTNASSLSFVCLDDSNNYGFVINKTFIGPWLSHYSLNDSLNNVSFRIEQGTPAPFVVYNYKLYIPKNFNEFTPWNNINILKLDCYDLKMK